ncbi:MAG: ribonuclease P protein component [bacterium]
MAKEKSSDNSLGRNEILRGFDSFKNIFDDHTAVSSESFILYYQFKNSNNTDNKSPSVKAGFIVSKKKVRKAFNRIKLKRYLRELYRHNKPAAIPDHELKLLISFSEFAIAGYLKSKKQDIKSLHPEFKSLTEKITLSK